MDETAKTKGTGGHSHAHEKACGCEHSHGPDHVHPWLSQGRRWLLSALIILGLLATLRPFIISQMLVRVASYAGISSYKDAIRMCKRIIVLDNGNIQAWTSLGYAYMDSSQTPKAIAAFEKVLILNPQDKGAASYELGRIYYAQGNDGRAIEYFERVRGAGARAGALLEADILKYRHGTLGFRSLHSMETLLEELMDSYVHTGNKTRALEVQKIYLYYKNKHRAVLF